MRNRNILNKNIPSHIAFFVIMVAGLAIALFTIKAGERIINSTQNSAIQRDAALAKELKDM